MTRKRFDSSPQFNVKEEGVLIQQVAGSSTNLLEVKAHNGTTLMAVDYAGTMTSGASNTFTYLAATTSASLPADTTIGAVSSTELGYLDGVTSALQTQLDSKLSTAVTSLTGTGDQISVSASTGGVTLSLPSTVSFPGRVNIASEKLWFGAQTRQMINLWSSNDAAPQYGIGVQGGTQYFRTGTNFAWYSGGSHNDAELNAGGGTRYAYLNSGGFVSRNKVYGGEGTVWVGDGVWEEDSAWHGVGSNTGNRILLRHTSGNNIYVISRVGGTIYLRPGGTSAADYSFNNTDFNTNGRRITMSAFTTGGRNYCTEWIQFDNHTGLYSPLNGAHFYPNNGSYGSWQISGSRNGWAGIEFASVNGGNLSLMMNNSSYGWGDQHVGVHNNTHGWIYYFQGRGIRTNSYLPISGNSTGQVGDWYGGAGAFNLMYAYGYVNYSDARTKHSVQSLEGGLDFIKRLRPVKYKYIYENHLGYEPDEHGVEISYISTEPVSVEYGSRYRYGFIAQEVKQALQDTGKNPADYAVWGLGDKDNPESTQQLEYLQFIGPLVAAVQELSAKVAVLEAERGL